MAFDVGQMATLRYSVEVSPGHEGYVRSGHFDGDCWRHAAEGYNEATKAVWSWRTAAGMTVQLCGPCCDEWQREAAADPSLRPASIEPIGRTDG